MNAAFSPLSLHQCLSSGLPSFFAPMCACVFVTAVNPMSVFSLKLTGCRQCRRGDSWRPKNPRIGLWGAGSLWTTVGLTEGRSACHMLIQGTHWARVCVFTRHASSCAWFELQSPDEPHAGPLASCTRALMHSWLPRGEYAFACVATPVPHLNPLTGRPGAPQAPRGPLEYPCKHTHTHSAGRMENITSSLKPVPFLISAV